MKDGNKGAMSGEAESLMPSVFDRAAIADYILHALNQSKEESVIEYRSTSPINYFYVDDVLPLALAQKISESFPKPKNMFLRKTLREMKYVSAQMNKHDALLEEVIFAFQDSRIVNCISEITGLRELEPDSLLYAGGISVMGKEHFLNPHVDNSHDKTRSRYRVLNLLFYVSPDWKLENGGNLELWPDGTESDPVTVVSKFNRLVVMVTHQNSWHSVSPIVVNQERMCISNYYFSGLPVGSDQYFHVTSFHGRPGQHLRDLVLRIDSFSRMFIRKIFPSGIARIRHFYKR